MVKGKTLYIGNYTEYFLDIYGLYKLLPFRVGQCYSGCIRNFGTVYEHVLNF